MAADPLQRLAVCSMRTAIFVFFAYIVVGSSWQLWVGAALFVIPQVLGVGLPIRDDQTVSRAIVSDDVDA
jgi:hypothetical protein